MKMLKFDGIEILVSEKDLQKNQFDVDFGGSLKVQFTKQENGNYKPTNAIDGWGNNCFNEIKDKEVVIETP